MQPMRSNSSVQTFKTFSNPHVDAGVLLLKSPVKSVFKSLLSAIILAHAGTADAEISHWIKKEQ
jgi:hypothetical protein